MGALFSYHFSNKGILGKNAYSPRFEYGFIRIVGFVWRQLELAFFGASASVGALFYFRKGENCGKWGENTEKTEPATAKKRGVRENDKTLQEGEERLMKAKIQYEKTQFSLIATIVWMIFWGLVLLIGFSNDGRYTRFLGLKVYIYSYEGAISIPLIVIIILIGFILPLIAPIIRKKWAERMRLTIDEEQIVGVYGRFSAKQLNLPIEKLDNVVITDTFFDKIRSGKTIVVSGASGRVIFPMCHNADEFAAEALKMIKNYKQNYRADSGRSNAQPQGGTADELKKYKDLLDNGIITQEEFDAKKKQLLGL